MSSQLIAALNAVDWSKNIHSLSAEVDLVSEIEQGSYRLAVWAGQLEQMDSKSAATVFIREMQHAGHNAACLIGLGLYKPAAASMRSMVECALYYTYFKSHPMELATQVRDSAFYVTKAEILDFHKLHTPEFSVRQGCLGFVSRLNSWYSRTSAIVHGQIPGVWSSPGGITSISFDPRAAREVVSHFSDAVSLAQDSFLCCVAFEYWRFFESTSKAFILKGMPGGVKESLKLDSA
ncbi:hypothetical protein [Lysobacter sp. GCM10012299]|uniref:hypothetical protein n=1 Tax=Lysobacter sp. GCM10012299 TaxID=3317333 RepID=UPI00361DB8DD